MSRNWILNDEIHHHKHGFIPEHETVVQMNLSYRRSKSGTVLPVASSRLDLNELLRRDLVRRDTYRNRSGFRLRFVHDPASCSVYIQKAGSPKRQLFGPAPPELR
jgi:hypothetical protein